MEQIFFLVLVAFVGLVRLLMQAAENKKNKEAEKRTNPAPNAPPPRASGESEEERVRKFFEALGVPTTSPSPPPIKQRPVVQKTPRPVARKIMPVDPFPRPGRPVLTPQEAEVPPTAGFPATPEIQPPPLPTAETSVFRPPPVIRKSQPENPPGEFEVFRVEETREARSTGPLATDAEGVVRPSDLSGGQSWSRRLATSEALRDLVVLREILGPPRGLQPLG